MSVVLDLPAWYVDGVVLDDLGLGLGDEYLRVINRNPEPDEVEVPSGTPIALDLASDASNTPGLSATQVFVKTGTGPEVLAYDGPGTGFQPGWDGPSSATSSPDANTRRVVIDPTTDFESLAVVTVRVLSQVTAQPGPQLDESWTFTIEDLTAPVLETALAREKAVVRVTFDEPVVMTDAADGALNPANYAFERLTVPAVNVLAEGVEQVTTSSVDVLLDIEMTPGATYRVTVTGVEDLKGNPIAAPFNAAEFSGFRPAVPEGRSFDLLRMLPQKNRDEDPGDLRKFVGVLQEVTDLLLCSIDRWTDILDPDRAPEAFLDAMLHDLGNPFAFDLSATEKRKLIRVLVSAYKQKGTAPGIINLVRFFLGIEVEIVAFAGEGWELGIDELGEDSVLGPGSSFGLYSFEIVSPVVLTPEQRTRIKEIADYMKPAHTHCIRIVEPEIPVVIDHLELGLSELGVNWNLH